MAGLSTRATQPGFVDPPTTQPGNRSSARSGRGAQPPVPGTPTNRFAGGDVTGRGVPGGGDPQKGSPQPMPSTGTTAGGKDGSSAQPMPGFSGPGSGMTAGGRAYQSTPGGGMTRLRAGGAPYNGNISPVDVNVQGLGLERYQQFADDAYASQTRRLDPQFESMDAQFRQQMVNQGLQEGTDAYDDARGNFDRNRTDAYGQARMLADQAALGVQQQAFGQNLSESQLANALQQAQMQIDGQLGSARIGANASMHNAGLQHSLGLGRNANDLLLGLGGLGLGHGQLDLANRNSDQNFYLGLGGLGVDQFNANQGAQNSNSNLLLSLLGLVPGQSPTQIDAYGPQRDNYTGRQNQYNQDQARDQQNAQFWTSLILSDRDAKDVLSVGDPEAMLAAVNAMPVDRWRYKHDGSIHVGPMAQDFHRVLGLPERRTIAPVDILGAILGSLQALTRRVEALEA